MSDEWAAYADEYDERVYSMTPFPRIRAKILENLRHGRVLNLGAGPTPYLNQELLGCENNIVIASDFCLPMLISGKKSLTHPRLFYVDTDSRGLSFRDEVFDSVVSIYSILPPERPQIQEILNESFRVLKRDGRFTGFFLAFDYTAQLAERIDLGGYPVDFEQMRERDTVGWQCGHTPMTINENLSSAGFSSFGVETILQDSPEELEEFKRLYGFDLEEFPPWTHFVVATK